ncbi:hypothetical protein CEV32_4003 [Brucella rhizosphaerae]|uniref:Uncharacterized protein n=1 Tax=Brucella rhizosphaerae TaxID=571254 RepID=A0A256FQW3_9HYPH|nr:hypothetical protein CEV32_4003 [Brucella rhizosphaerae]
MRLCSLPMIFLSQPLSAEGFNPRVVDKENDQSIDAGGLGLYPK